MNLPNHNTTADAGVADVLERAADRLSKRGGWGRRLHGLCETSPCMGKALEIEAGKPSAPVFAALFAVAPFSDLSGLVRWNDAPGRKQVEVVRLLRQAAAIAKATNK